MDTDNYALPKLSYPLINLIKRKQNRQQATGNRQQATGKSKSMLECFKKKKNQAQIVTSEMGFDYI